MSPESKRRLLRYGIAADLVIVITGVALLLPQIPAPIVVALYVVAVALSAVKGGWRGGLAATLCGLIALLLAFHAAIPLTYTAAFVALGIAVCAGAAFLPGRQVAMRTAAVPLAPVVAFPDEKQDEKRERAEQERAARERAAAEKAARDKAEQERVAAETLARERAEREAAERAAREKAEQERIARERAEAERVAAETLARERAAREAAERAAKAEQERIAREREELARKLEEERAARERAEREAAERAAREKAEQERIAHEHAELARRLDEERAERERIARERADAERLAAETLQRERAELARKVEEERAARERAERELAERDKAEREHIARERAEAERVAAETLERERAELARKLDEERAARERAERDAREGAERERATREKAEHDAAERLGRETKKPEAPKRGLFASLFRREPAKPSINLRPKTPPRPAPRVDQRAVTQRTRRPRILLLEKRRGTADTIMPKLKQRLIEAEVVERWIDAVDELFRFRPDAFFLDVELPDFDKVYKAVTEHAPSLPIILTSRPNATLPRVRHAATLPRPYDAEAVIAIARKALESPDDLLAMQAIATESLAPPPPPPPRPAPRPQPLAAPPKPVAKPAPAPEPPQHSASVSPTEQYLVTCFNCRVQFDAVDADWCSCLTKERTLVCTNCLTCFCKAPPSFKEKFWIAAPPRLFERKTAELKRQTQSAGSNPPPEEVRRPLVMLVEDDDDIKAIVQRVCNNLGYGFVSENNGQDGLRLARTYRPNLILSDAFMPKLDGREMCRILKEEPGGVDCRMIVMTGLYTDTKYKSEALKRFHIDDYLSKPVSITDLINLLQRHLEGVTGLPAQEDLHELHRRDIDEMPDDGVPLAELLENDREPQPDRVEVAPAPPKPKPRSDAYEICCYTCNETFDATHAEWCTCLGRDNTLVCPRCNNCFCKAPAAYRERFWIDAPPSLFERKIMGSKRAVAAKNNPQPAEVKRPLILLVEDDENIQLIVKTVVTTMNYGFIVADDGQEGLTMARQYNPDLILSDAFMPKLDGREMCRLLKEDPSTARVKAIIMTGLYTDRKYRNEALSYFKVDDYVAKPLAVDDLIKLMKKHLPQDIQPTM